MNRKGQAATEMVLIIPMMIAVIAGGMVIVYSCWQGIKVQQGANLAARIQSEERVAGGLTQGDIQDTNGVGVDMSTSNGDDDPTATTAQGQTQYKQGNPDGVYGKLRNAVRAMFGAAEDGVYVPPPVIGQNIDSVKVIRVLNLSKIPFFNGSAKLPQQIKIQSTAWGGEDTFMYGLPRWGQIASTNGGSSDLEWQQLIKNGKNVQGD